MNAVQLDGMIFERRGIRLRDIPAGALLSWAYSLMVKNLDAKKRRELDYALMPRALTVIDDPDLPAELQGMRPPSWYREDAPPTSGRLSGFTV